MVSLAQHFQGGIAFAEGAVGTRLRLLALDEPAHLHERSFTDLEQGDGAGRDEVGQPQEQGSDGGFQRGRPQGNAEDLPGRGDGFEPGLELSGLEVAQIVVHVPIVYRVYILWLFQSEEPHPMADNPKTTPTSESALSVEERASVFWNTAEESWRKNQSTWLVVLAIVACALAAWGFRTWKQRDSREAAHRLYGKAIVYLENGRTDSATALLQKVLASYSGPEASKAALQLGHDRYMMRDWSGALSKYIRAKEDAAGYPLLDASARRGIAASQVELGRFADADATLQGILSSYQKLTGDPSARAREEEPQDQVPALEQVMWQQVLVREKLGRAADAVAVAQKILRLYPQTGTADEARAWLALNGKAPEIL